MMVVAGITLRFLPTPSVRRATISAGKSCQAWSISTHALREEGDRPRQDTGQAGTDFYPRPP